MDEGWVGLRELVAALADVWTPAALPVEPVRGCGCSPGHSNRKELGGNSGPLFSERCPAISRTPGASQACIVALLYTEGSMLECPFVGCSYRPVQVVKSKPAFGGGGGGAAAAARICRRRGQKVIDLHLLPLQNLHFLFLFHMRSYCSLLSSGYWGGIRSCTLSVPPSALTQITGYWSYSNRRVQRLYLTRVPVSKTLRRVHCPHCASGVGWQFACRVSPWRMLLQVSRTHKTPSCGLKYKAVWLLAM
jgi:hypothetical protein